MSVKSLPMMPWYPGDFMTATRGWKVTARGVYRELLDAQWDMGALPADPEELRCLINATEAEWQTGWQKCEMKFPVGEDRQRRNARLEMHRSKAVRLTEAKRHGAAITNAKRGAERTHSAMHSGALCDTQSGTHPSPEPSPEPSPNARHPFHSAVIAAYHEILPDLPAVKIWNDKRRQALTARIRERCRDGKPADTIDYWRDFFGAVAASDFLCGRTKNGWCADLAWLLNPQNFAKTIEGNYQNRRGTNGARAHV